MKKTVVLFYYQIIEENYICNAVVPSLNQDSGEVQMAKARTSLNSSVFQILHSSSENAKYCQFQRRKKLNSPPVCMVSSKGSNIWNQREQRIGI
jgi:hypothetical protein